MDAAVRGTRTNAPSGASRTVRGGRRLIAVLAATVALLAWAGVGLATAPVARAADTTGQHITRYTADVAVTADGVARVRLQFDFDFGNDPGHGPYLTLPTRQQIDGNDKQDRVFRNSAITVNAGGM